MDTILPARPDARHGGRPKPSAQVSNRTGALHFPNGTVPTLQEVHPTPLYEALAAFAIGALLWRLRRRLSPLALFGLYAVLMGLARFLVEFVRLNDGVLLGLSQPQLWSLVLVLFGLWAAWRAGSPPRLPSSGPQTSAAG